MDTTLTLNSPLAVKAARTSFTRPLGGLPLWEGADDLASVGDWLPYLVAEDAERTALPASAERESAADALCALDFPNFNAYTVAEGERLVATQDRAVTLGFALAQTYRPGATAETWLRKALKWMEAS